jgi:hypothetical protein
MFLVLCSLFDTAAHWASRGLQALGLEPLLMVTTEMLSSAVPRKPGISRPGDPIALTLANGCTVSFSDRTVRGVLNRLVATPGPRPNTQAISGPDYTHPHMSAFCLSWLSSLSCPVLNRPTPQGFAGRYFHISDWEVLASQAGLVAEAEGQIGNGPAEIYRSKTHSQARMARVIVFQNQIFGSLLPDAIRKGCCRLAKLSGAPLLGIDFQTSPEGMWTFSKATPMPDLMIGGAALLQSLAAFLQSS